MTDPLVGGGVDSDRRPGRLIDRLLWFAASVPALALVLLGSMVVRVRLSSGDWPVRNQPDPKELGLHNDVTLVMILLSFLVVIAVPVGSLVGYFTGHHRIDIRPIVVALSCFVLLAVVLRGDLGGVGQWIAD